MTHCEPGRRDVGQAILVRSAFRFGCMPTSDGRTTLSRRPQPTPLDRRLSSIHLLRRLSHPTATLALDRRRVEPTHFTERAHRAGSLRRSLSLSGRRRRRSAGCRIRSCLRRPRVLAAGWRLTLSGELPRNMEVSFLRAIAASPSAAASASRFGLANGLSTLSETSPTRRCR